MYSKEERTSALSVYSLGIPIGIMAAYLASAALLGADVEAVNWRRIFYILGISGIILAVIVRIIVREPLRGAMESAAREKNADGKRSQRKERGAALFRLSENTTHLFRLSENTPQH